MLVTMRSVITKRGDDADCIACASSLTMAWCWRSVVEHKQHLIMTHLNSDGTTTLEMHGLIGLMLYKRSVRCLKNMLQREAVSESHACLDFMKGCCGFVGRDVHPDVYHACTRTDTAATEAVRARFTHPHGQAWYRDRCDGLRAHRKATTPWVRSQGWQRPLLCHQPRRGTHRSLSQHGLEGGVQVSAATAFP